MGFNSCIGLYVSSNRFSDRIFVISKSSGPTSFDVVDAFRSFAGVKKAGHAGTLDPIAEGVLLICTGRATRAISYFVELPKLYECQIKLGVGTTTLDREGDVTSTLPCPKVGLKELSIIAQSFVGGYEQVPPVYSALKIKGRRLYDLARKGEILKPEKRKVFIKHIEITKVELPFVRFKMLCSRGTYVRSFARDFAAKLSVPAHVTELVRLAVGDFSIDQAIQDEFVFRGHLSSLKGMSLEEALIFLPSVVLIEQACAGLINGVLPRASHVLHRSAGIEAGKPIRILNPREELLAVGRAMDNDWEGDKSIISSYKLFKTGDRV